MDSQVDVLIIGAGPAGLAAGIVCGRQGLRTLVCDKRRLPADKACGEGLMPTGLRHLEQLGVKPYLRAGRHFPLHGIRYLSSKGTTARADFREGPGWGIPRLDLSSGLLQRATTLESLEIRPAVRATSMGVEKNRIWVKVDGDCIAARLVVGADGLQSSVRQWAGLEGGRGTHQRWGARQHFKVGPWSQEVEIHWGKGMEAYVTPCADDLVGVAFLWDRGRHPQLPGGDRLIPALLEAFPELARRLKYTPVSDSPLAVGPLQRRASAPIAYGVLLIGDAAGYLDALTGEGLSLAFAQALALERTVIPRLLSPHTGLLSRQDLVEYQRAYQAIMRPYYQVTHLVLWLSRHPALAEQAIGLLGRNPGLFQSLLSANMGTLPLWKVIFSRTSGWT